MVGLGVKPKSKRVGDQKANKKMQWYSASYNDLYTIFQKKNMIDEAENINEPEGYQHTESIGLSLKSPEIFPSEEALTTNSTNSIPETGDSEFDEEVYESSSDEESELEYAECSKSSAPITKKVPPPIPPKPIKLQVKKESIPELISEPVPEPVSEPTNTNLELEGPELHPQIDEDEFLNAILTENDVSEPVPEPEIIDSTPEPEIKEEIIEPIPDPIAYTDEKLEELYQGVKSNWEEYGNDPEDFDWECFIKEIIDHKNHPQYDYKEDPFHYRLRMHIQWYRATTKTNSTVEEIASKISEYYYEKRGQLYVPPPKNYRTGFIEVESSINEKECALADGGKVFSDDADEEW